MNIKLKVKARGLWNHDERALAKSIVQWGIARLGLWACPARLVVILRDFPEYHYGDSLDLDDKFVIRISKQGDWIKTIFHELEHVRQFADDELELESKVAMWRGTMFKDVDYDSSPWEVMAREVEEQLYDEFIHEISS